jgi:phospholipase C
MDAGRIREFKPHRVKGTFGRLSVALLAVVLVSAMGVQVRANQRGSRDGQARPATPIRHLVVIYDENVSFDHYFATYPEAVNPPGEPRFVGAPGTPTLDNLRTAGLLSSNPNADNPGNGGRFLPFRLDRSQAATADQNHQYAAEQQAEDGGKADLFPLFTGRGTPGGGGAFGTKGLVMGYYDGNTVTALWNYAQHFAMSDRAYGNAYGPSTPGALEVVSGQTNGVKLVQSSQDYYYIQDGQGGLTLIDDVDPAFDKCSKGDEVMMLGKNIGDLLNAHAVSWGGFMGGFDLDLKNRRTGTAPPAASEARFRLSSTARGRITFPITTGSSTTPRPPIRSTCRRARSLRSDIATRRTASLIRRTTNMEWASSGRLSMPETCPPYPF